MKTLGTLIICCCCFFLPAQTQSIPVISDGVSEIVWDTTSAGDLYISYFEGSGDASFHRVLRFSGGKLVPGPQDEPFVYSEVYTQKTILAHQVLAWENALHFCVAYQETGDSLTYKIQLSRLDENLKLVSEASQVFPVETGKVLFANVLMTKIPDNGFCIASSLIRANDSIAQMEVLDVIREQKRWELKQKFSANGFVALDYLPAGKGEKSWASGLQNLGLNVLDSVGKKAISMMEFTNGKDAKTETIVSFSGPPEEAFFTQKLLRFSNGEIGNMMYSPDLLAFHASASPGVPGKEYDSLFQRIYATAPADPNVIVYQPGSIDGLIQYFGEGRFFLENDTIHGFMLGYLGDVTYRLYDLCISRNGDILKYQEYKAPLDLMYVCGLIPRPGRQYILVFATARGLELRVINY